MESKDAATLIKELGSISFVDGVTPIGGYSPTSLSLGPFSCPWAPLIDGVELMAHPLILAKECKTNPATISIMHGNNRDEAEMFTAKLPIALNASGFNAYLGSVYGAENTANVTALYVGTPTQSAPCSPLHAARST